MRRILVATAALVCAVSMLAFAQGSQTKSEEAFDHDAYDTILDAAVQAIGSGEFDADKLIADMEKLVDLGVKGCKGHMVEAETPDDEKKIMEIVIANAKKMSLLRLEKIETQWHEGAAFKKEGVDVAKYDQHSEVMSHCDTVVHPATCIICLNDYKRETDDAKKKELLDQIKDELAEVHEHMEVLE